MSRLEVKDTIKVNQNNYKVGDLLKTLIYLPASALKEWFETIGLSVPRQVRITVLKEVLRENALRTRIERKTLADELNYRLSWFNEYTEIQLENLLVFYDDESLDKTYYEMLWVEFINYFLAKEVPLNRIQELIDLSIDHVKKDGLKLQNTKEFNQTLSPVFFDRKNEIDGLPLQKIRPVLYKSSTLVEIRELGSKYGVDVPKRLKKNQLADIIIAELKDRGLHTDAEEAKVRSMSILVLQRYAIDNDIKASTELKKEETIEYILKNANETKETYFVPETRDVYETELNDKADLPEPVVAPEVIEEAAEEVVEEAVVEDAIEHVKEVVVEREVVQSNVDVSALVEELKLLRKVVEEKDSSIVVNGSAQTATHEKARFDTNQVLEDHLETVLFVGTKKEWKKTNKEALNDLENEVEEATKVEQSSTSDLPKHFELIVPSNQTSKTDIVELNFFKKTFKFLLRLIIVLAIVLIVYGVVAALTDFKLGVDIVDKFVEFVQRFIKPL